MRKIRFRYIKENGKSTSVTVRCSLKRKLIIFYFERKIINQSFYQLRQI